MGLDYGLGLWRLRTTAAQVARPVGVHGQRFGLGFWRL
jgi:hypothetical protein